LRAAGFAVCKPDAGTKRPRYRGWSTRSLEPDDFAPHDPVGILAGPLSDGNRPGHALVEVDLDDEAALALADLCLPATGMVEGRPGKTRSHRYYLVPVASIPEDAHSTAPQAAAAAREATGHPGPKLRHFCHPDTGRGLIDFIGTGGMVVCPPSRHPSGEVREWTGGESGEAAVVGYPELWSAVCQLAEACGWRPGPARSGVGHAAGDGAAAGGAEDGVGAGDGCTDATRRRAVAYLAQCDPAISGQGGHADTFWAARAVVRGFGLGAGAGYELLRDHYNPRCRPPWTQAELWHKCVDAEELPFDRPVGWLLEEADDDGDGGEATDAAAGGAARVAAGTVPGAGRRSGAKEAADDPHRLARLYLGQRCTHADGKTLRHWRGEWHRWDGTAYRTLPDQELRADLTAVVKEEMDRINEIARRLHKGDHPPTARQVTTKLIANVAHALVSLTVVPSRTGAPAWVDGDGPWPAAEVLACRNGLVHLPSFVAGQGCVVPPTPRFFSPLCLDYDFDPTAPAPSQWLEFLGRLWRGDRKSVETLQELFGYTLTPDTSQQKVFLLIGPKRSGKGTIARVQRALVGPDNVAGPTLASLGTNFGLQPLLGKTLAVVSDARLSGRTDAAVVVERLLSISGEDAQTIDRKYLTPVTVRLPTRFVILTNELPRLGDASGALPGRMVLLRLTRSWYGREDTTLTDRLLTELPGILLWSVQGWKRLRDRGHFVQPASGRALLEELEDLASPVGAFVRDCCVLGAGRRVTVEEIYGAWQRWCAAAGRREPGTREVFGRDLLAAVPTVRPRRLRTGAARPRAYQGIGLKPGR
jgi:putative DNA primase/helicase